MKDFVGKIKKSVWFYIFLFICIFLVCLFILFSSFDNGESEIQLPDKKVYLTLVDDTLTNKGASFLLENKSGKDIYFEEAFYLEIYKNNKWYRIEADEDAFSDSFISSYKSNGSREIPFDWTIFGYGELSSGRYRILKNIWFGSDTEKIEEFYIAGEFTIK